MLVIMKLVSVRLLPLDRLEDGVWTLPTRSVAGMRAKDIVERIDQSLAGIQDMFVSRKRHVCTAQELSSLFRNGRCSLRNSMR